MNHMLNQFHKSIHFMVKINTLFYNRYIKINENSVHKVRRDGIVNY